MLPEGGKANAHAKEVTSLRTYEALYIVQPDLDDDGIQTIAKEVESLVEKNGGTIVRSEIWGRRKLAYPVKKHTDGCYVLLRFQALPELLPRLENYFKLSEHVIRNMVVYFDEHTLRLEAEQQRRKEEEIRFGAPNRGRRDVDDDEDDDDPIPVAAGRHGRRRDTDEDDDEDEETE